MLTELFASTGTQERKTLIKRTQMISICEWDWKTARDSNSSQFKSAEYQFPAILTRPKCYVIATVARFDYPTGIPATDYCNRRYSMATDASVWLSQFRWFRFKLFEIILMCPNWCADGSLINDFPDFPDVD